MASAKAVCWYALCSFFSTFTRTPRQSRAIRSPSFFHLEPDIAGCAHFLAVRRHEGSIDNRSFLGLNPGSEFRSELLLPMLFPEIPYHAASQGQQTSYDRWPNAVCHRFTFDSGRVTPRREMCPGEYE